METMFRRSLLLSAALLTVSGVLFSLPGLRAQDSSSSTDRWTRKYKPPPPSARIQVTVLKADNGKPIENAAVIFHPIEGDKDKGYMELKSDEDGKAMIDVIPVGDTVRLQVIANGFQTYGGDYKIDKPEVSMEVKLKRPQSQYSIYKDNGAAASNNGSQGGSKAASPDKSTPPAAQNDKSSNSGSSGSSQSGSQSGQGQNQNQNQSQNQKQPQTN
jgi:hypothetical protein